MKIDRTKLKKSSSKIPPDCKALIDRLKSCNNDDLLEELSKINIWNFGKHELSHWMDVLDMFDHILERSCETSSEKHWHLLCDEPNEAKLNKLLQNVLHVTTILVEHCFNWNFYNSMEHLTSLLASSDMKIVLAVLNLIYVFSKRSHLIEKLKPEKKQKLFLRLFHLAETWGGKENGFGLADCCQNLPITAYPSTASTLHYEYYVEVTDKNQKIIEIHLENLEKLNFKSPAEIMENLIEKYAVPEDKQMQLFSHIRLAHSFPDYPKRIMCVQARLQALSILVYCNALNHNRVSSILYNGLVEELVDILELKDDNLIETKVSALKAFAAIVHHYAIKLNIIIEATGIASYHGFLPVLVRKCIQSLTEPDSSESFPMPFATALFSFLFHLANATYENGRDAFISCGMVEALLKVIHWHSVEADHVAIAARAVRVIDFIRYLDKQSFMQAFQAHGGISTFIWRLEMEVGVCRKERSYVIEPEIETSNFEGQSSSETSSNDQSIGSKMEVDIRLSDLTQNENTYSYKQQELYKECLPQRSALLKSMLSFLKKSIQESMFSDSMRHLMDGSLSQSLIHIISNPEYYGISIFQLATDIVTAYVFQEPTLLSTLQNNGLTDVILHALLVNKIPAKRRVIASLANVFSALCLNVRGLQAFIACKPFEKLFRILILPEYIHAMKKRRGSDTDPAVNLGTAVDELMRHQPSLRKDAITAVIKLLEELCVMGRDPRYICSKTDRKIDTVAAAVRRPADVVSDAESSDEDNNDADEDSTSSTVQVASSELTGMGTSNTSNDNESKISVPLMDYILNVVRFLDAVLNRNSTDDHCREFVNQKGLAPLISLLSLPNLPVDFPLSPICQAVSGVCKTILTLTYERQVLNQGLLCLYDALQALLPLHLASDIHGGSVLLQELVACSESNNLCLSAQSTPLLHHMSVAHEYINMFFYVCQIAQAGIPAIVLNEWSSDLGLKVLKELSSLYTSLIWENTVLLTLSNNKKVLNEDCKFARQQLKKLLLKGSKMNLDDTNHQKTVECGSNIITTAMEALNTNNPSAEYTDSGDQNACNDGTCSCISSNPESKCAIEYSAQVKEIKTLLYVTSKLGHGLSNLLGLLVKLCVGLPMRLRRFQPQMPPVVPSHAAHLVASEIVRIVINGFSWIPASVSPPVPSFQLTFYLCSMGFASSVLFDERKYPYYLMLEKFFNSGGVNAFFSMFSWAITLKMKDDEKSVQLIESIGEFFDIWLILLEKLVNPLNILDSPHELLKSVEDNQSFNPILYLTHIHKRAYTRIMQLWDRESITVNGERIAQSMLAVICHLIKGEAILKEKLSPESVNQDNLKQLINMGFSKGLATEALLNTSSLEQATEYLLSYPYIRSGTTSENPDVSSMDWELSEEEQMIQAIAMSLGENAVVSTDQVEGKQKEYKSELQEVEPLSTGAIDEITSKMLHGCLCLADALPDTVYKICELLISVKARNGEEWCKKHLIDILLNEIEIQICSIMERVQSEAPANISAILFEPKLENKIAVRLHLFTLIFEEMKFLCPFAIKERNLMPIFINLLEVSTNHLNSSPDKQSPKWLPFLILFIDQYEKASIMSIRKIPLLLAPKRQWKWGERQSNKWTDYCADNNKLIDDAFKSGKTSVRFTLKGTKYMVSFKSMAQINEDTGKSRPILCIIDSSDNKQTKTDGEKNKEQVPIPEEVVAEGTTNGEKEKLSDSKQSQLQPEKLKTITRLSHEQCRKLVELCVSLLKIPLQPNSLQAVLRLCLLLTREHENAIIFANMNGPKILLSLTESNAFPGFYSIINLLFRHILEDPVTLKASMEKAIFSALTVTPGVFNPNGVDSAFKAMGAIACRNSDLFTAVASNVLRLSVKSVIDHGVIKTIQVCPTNLEINTETQTENEEANYIIYSLLNALIAKPVQLPDKGETVSEAQPSSSDCPTNDPVETVDLNSCFYDHIRSARSFLRHGVIKKVSDNNKSDKSSSSNSPAITKSGICQLLAEFVISYQYCAKLIIEYSYHAGDSELILEDCTALTYIIDNLLYNNETNGDKAIASTSKVLISALAAHCSSISCETQLVSEVQSSLNRALSLPESAEKHLRIQSLTDLINMIIETCSFAFSANNSGGSQKVDSNIVSIFLEKDIIVTLARIPHHLDLSSPHLASTINSAMKPLDRLSFLMNLSTTDAMKKSKNKVSSTHDVDVNQGCIEQEMEIGDTTITCHDAENTIQNIEGSTSFENDAPENLFTTLQEPISSTAGHDEDANIADLNIAVSEQVYPVIEDMDDIEQEQHIDEIGTNFHLARSFEDPNYAFVIDSQHESIYSGSSSESEHSQTEDHGEQEVVANEGGAEEVGVEDEVQDDDDDDDDIVVDEGIQDTEEHDNEDRDDFSEVDGFDHGNLFRLLFQLEDSIDSTDLPYHIGVGGSRLGGRFRETSGETANENQNAASSLSQIQCPLMTMHPLLDPNGDMSEPSESQNFRYYRSYIRNGRWDVLSRNTSGRHPNPPVILQSFLGLNATDDLLQLATESNSRATSAYRRRLSSDDLFTCFFNEEHMLNLQNLHVNNPYGMLSALPSINNRWNEESRVLDGNSVHDLIAGLKSIILKCLEAYRKDEISQEKEKKKKDKKKKQNGTEISVVAETVPVSNNQNNNSESVPMEVAESSNTNVNEFSEIVSVDVLVPPPDQIVEAIQQTPTTVIANSIHSADVSLEASETSNLNSSTLTLMNNTPEVEIQSEEIQTEDQPTSGSAVTVAGCASIPNEDDASSNNEESGLAGRVSSEMPVIAENDAPSTVPNILDGVEVPEGVDPSFLAALPDNIRQEVIAEQLRLQHLRQRAQNSSSDTAEDGTSFTEVNPEFLAALPENIQQEVLAQQRAEQQRLASQHSNPDSPVDPTNFLQSLPQNLRQQVLSDIDDSLLPLLPPDLASQARALQRSLESHRNQMHENFFAFPTHSTSMNSALSRAIRSATHGTTRYSIQILTSGSPMPSRREIQLNPRNAPILNKIRCKKLGSSVRLDYESLACLLVLLFIDDPKLNTGRLYRVIKNFCLHGPTLQWILKSLLSILERTEDHKLLESCISEHTDDQSSGNKISRPSWLSISLDAALGCRTNIFIFLSNKLYHQGSEEQLPNVQTQSNVPQVAIHPLASSIVIRHVLESLISFSKSFAISFLPKIDKVKKAKDFSNQNSVKCDVDTPSCSKSDTSNTYVDNDMWNILVKLDSLYTTSSKGKTVMRKHSNSTLAPSASTIPDGELKTTDFISSPIAQLIRLLCHPVVKRSSQLIDRLLKLLHCISLALNGPNLKSKENTDFRQLIMEDDRTTCNSPFHEEFSEIVSISGTSSKTTHCEDTPKNLTVKHYLKLVVDVLISKKCSEKGLQDATFFLSKVSDSCLRARETIMYLLLDGARELGSLVCYNILALMQELQYSAICYKTSKSNDNQTESDRKVPVKGFVQDRFTNKVVVITAPVQINSGDGKDLQLQSMQALTGKSSSQAFFLRILKVIVKLAESAKHITQTRKTETNIAPESTTDVKLDTIPPSSESCPLATMQSREEPYLFNVDGSFNLSAQLKLDELWDALSSCLTELAETTDHHAVLVLQPTVEAFFLVHGSSEKIEGNENRHDTQNTEIITVQDSSSTSSVSSHSEHCRTSDNLSSSSFSPDTLKFLKFAETHQAVLNQILRESAIPLAKGPFKVLVDHTKVLDFDVKRRYFRQELERMGSNSRHDVGVKVVVRREHVFEDSFIELHRRSSADWKHNFYIVFEGEEGQDAGGLLREWYTIISREIFNPMYALFTTSPGDRVTYMINSSSHCNSNHLSYFKFVGRVIAKAVYDNKLLECYFTRSFYKHILGKPVKYTDMESEDYSFYQGLVFLLEHNVQELGSELTFSVEGQEFGVTSIHDLKPNGQNIPVTEENKHEYVSLVCQEKMTGAIRQQLDAFLSGFYEIIPFNIISIFNEQELELLISGLPSIDIDDLKANTEYYKYQPNSLQIQWFWLALRSFDQADRAKFLQFVTGTSKVPLQGFAALEGMDGIQKFQIHKFDCTDRLPTAHTCFNQLDLPAYETYDKLRSMLLKAIHECSEGFGFA